MHNPPSLAEEFALLSSIITAEISACLPALALLHVLHARTTSAFAASPIDGSWSFYDRLINKSLFPLGLPSVGMQGLVFCSGTMPCT